ncbi:26S proteasome regulatory subunit 8-like isoform X2 [Macadamia integrifolia]|uniref:26S proteasome regulatory subunit 8-like isoform X2 n=1 Tax=Macadamia integrifolia TaxID=60698 RepID=UPI001C4FF352|nr:26S proteasome regulatory subunit 8-like isoform X2 [Macadamia integrifolia]
MRSNSIEILSSWMVQTLKMLTEITVFPEARLNVLKEYSRKILVMPGVDLKKIADKMIGACGPELEEVCREARIFTLRGKRVHVLQEDFEMAMAKVMKDKQKKTFSERLSKAKMVCAAIKMEEAALREMNQGDAFERKLNERFKHLLHHLHLVIHINECHIFENTYRISRDHVLKEELKQLENGQYARDVQNVVGESEFSVHHRFDTLRLHSRKMRLMPGIDLKKIAREVNVASEAKIKDVAAEARTTALLKGRVVITHTDFEIAAAKVMEKEKEKEKEKTHVIPHVRVK